MTMEQKLAQVSEDASIPIVSIQHTSSSMKTEKTCHVCKQLLPITEFYTATGHNDGFQSRCIACEKKYKRERRHLTRDKHNAYRKKWRAKNRERLLAADRKYRQEHKEVWAAKERRRRAKQAGNPVFKISAKELKRLYDSPCVYCGTGGKMTLDHVIPIHLGGSHSIGNLVPACGSCNFSKGKKLLMQWKMERVSNDQE